MKDEHYNLYTSFLEGFKEITIIKKDEQLIDKIEELMDENKEKNK